MMFKYIYIYNFFFTNNNLQKYFVGCLNEIVKSKSIILPKEGNLVRVQVVDTKVSR